MKKETASDIFKQAEFPALMICCGNCLYYVFGNCLKGKAEGAVNFPFEDCRVDYRHWKFRGSRAPCIF